MSKSEIIIDQTLPSRAPDLVVVADPDGAWQVQQVSEKLSAWVGLGALDISGHLLNEMFDDVSPGLDYLADEASSSKADIAGPGHVRRIPDPIKITFPLMAIEHAGTQHDH